MKNNNLEACPQKRNVLCLYLGIFCVFFGVERQNQFPLSEIQTLRIKITGLRLPGHWAEDKKYLHGLPDVTLSL